MNTFAPPMCTGHPGIDAEWQCSRCQRQYCSACLRWQKVGASLVGFCPHCNTICQSLTGSLPPQTITNISMMKEVLHYPFRANGVYLMLGGVIVFGIANLISFVGILSLIIAVIMGGYMSAYSLSIITSTAQGSDEPPPWPDFSNFQDDIMHPLIQVMGTLWICFFPPVLVRLWLPDPNWQWLYWLLLSLGIFYAPMALLGVAMFDSLSALNPLLILPSICRIFGRYLVAVVCLAFLYELQDVILGKFTPKGIYLNLISGILGWFVGLYFILAEMRLLGLLYRNNRQKLSWFD